MSMNIHQVYIANPITVNASTDLMYFGQSPYGVTNDVAMTFANFSSQFVLATVIINPAHGGTGINNGTNTITIGGNVSFVGAFTFAGTLTGNTAVTFPTSGTLATTSQLFTWNNVTISTQLLAVNNGYITNDVSLLVTHTLPVTAAIGSIIRIAGNSANGWTIAQNASQLIHVGNQVTTTGIGGSVSSTNAFDAVELICVVANTTFNVINGVGNFTIV